jgi:uncharacterized protein
MTRGPEQILQIMRRTGKRSKASGCVCLFGSAARGEATEGSDLDFLVELEKKTFDNYMDLIFFLEELFNCKVDLVMKENIKPRLREPILKETVYVTGF